MSSLERMLGLLDLFDEDRHVWTVDEAIATTGYSRSTVYRYFKTLGNFGLLEAVAGGGYVLGPGVIELDRRIRQSDRLMRAAGPVAVRLSQEFDEDVHISRAYGEKAILVHHECRPSDSEGESLRGLARPLYRGAAGRLLLSYMPTRRLRAYYDRHSGDLSEVGLGGSWAAVKSSLRKLRRDRLCASEGEVLPGMIGIGAPVVDEENRGVAAIAVVLPTTRDNPARRRVLCEAVRAAGAEIGEALGSADRLREVFITR